MASRSYYQRCKLLNMPVTHTVTGDLEVLAVLPRSRLHVEVETVVRTAVSCTTVVPRQQIVLPVGDRRDARPAAVRVDSKRRTSVADTTVNGITRVHQVTVAVVAASVAGTVRPAAAGSAF